MSTPDTALPGRTTPVFAKLGLGALSLIAANAGLLVLYFVYDLSLFQLVLVYWWECLWIGLFSSLKLIVASIIGDPYENRWATVSRSAAFLSSIVVIGFVGTSFLALLGGVGIAIFWAQGEFGPAATGVDALDSMGVIIGSSLLFLAGHGISFFVNFLGFGEYKLARVGTLLVLPFKRCLAVGVTVTFSFVIVAFVPGLASTAAFAAFVVIMKLLWDVYLHYRERDRFAKDFRDAIAATS